MEFVNEKLNEFNQYLSGKKVAIIGLGTSNVPLIEYMRKYKANVTVFDNRNIDDIDKSIMDKVVEHGMTFSIGHDYLSKLKGFDLIFRSPSCLPNRKELIEEAKRGAIVTTEIEMLLELAPCKIIGITGSDGKTTTTTLTYEILKAKGYNVWLGGNIGTPLFTKVSEMLPEDIVVLEMSSFQLMNMKISPSISVVTNVTPNHLDYHTDLEEYTEAKKEIFRHQDEKGILVLNYDNLVTREFAKEANGEVIFFSDRERLDNGYIVDEGTIKFCENNLRKHILNVKDVALIGKHNYQNICAALAATRTLVDEMTAKKVVSEFVGVHHRLELVKNSNKNVKWYNDSASSSPTRTISGIKAFDKKVVLIAGGYDKNLDYTPIGEPIVDGVKTLILMGSTKLKIYKAVTDELEKQNKKMDIYEAFSLEEAIEIADDVTKSGDIVLFSPASASFDMFKNAYDRGDKFRAAVQRKID